MHTALTHCLPLSAVRATLDSPMPERQELRKRMFPCTSRDCLLCEHMMTIQQHSRDGLRSCKHSLTLLQLPTAMQAGQGRPTASKRTRRAANAHHARSFRSKPSRTADAGRTSCYACKYFCNKDNNVPRSSDAWSETTSPERANARRHVEAFMLSCGTLGNRDLDGRWRELCWLGCDR